ncbi:MAG: SUMF1/EgtB/PvdO family nonheme iron enzyme [Saprospiraceae bacterium]|nr:SUMF1/EgtB/PvdO family nonheme iron enzyme [Saprospiraceae bacterium]
MFRRLTLCYLSILFFSIASNAQNTFEQKIPGTSVTIPMTELQAGNFLMGSPANEKNRKDNEGPQAQISLDAFAISTYEVSYEQYILFQDKSAEPEPKIDAISRPSPPYIDFTQGMGKQGGFPANSMSPYAALTYCKWLYEKTGIFYRLPTEAEWEYACRAGSTEIYPFGKNAKQLKEYAWFSDNSDDKYHKIGQLKPNAWGLYDMLGNVAEWTMDEYDDNYFTKISNNLNNPLIEPNNIRALHTVKGGSYQDEPETLRPAARLKQNPVWNRRDPQIPKSKWWNTDAPFVGFRIVKPLKQPNKEEANAFYDKYLKE